MAFTLAQRQDLTTALAAAFNWGELERAFRDQLGVRLDTITPNAAVPVVVEAVLTWAEQRGWERPLVRMMAETRPDQPQVTVFFERNREFPPLLPPDQREQLRVGLSAVIRTVGQLRQLVAAQPEFEGLLGGALDESDAETYLVVLVRWADHFDHLDDLLERVLRAHGTSAVVDAQVRPLVAALRVRRAGLGRPRALDPYDACDLDGTLMIDRTPLRDVIRSVAQGQGPRVFGIAGEPRSGKSHSRYFIQHISEHEQKYDAVIVDLNDEAPATFRPDLLIKRILRAWGRNELVTDIPVRDPTDSEARWVTDLADFLLGTVRRAQRLLVIVLDGFANDKLHLGTRDLLVRLVEQAAISQYLRLILLHYPDELLAQNASGRIKTDRIAPITAGHVRDFVRAYARQHGDDPEDAELDAFVDGVFQPPPPSTNEETAHRVDRLLRELMQP